MRFAALLACEIKGEDASTSHECSHIALFTIHACLAAFMTRRMYDSGCTVLKFNLDDIAQHGVPMNQFGVQQFRAYHWGEYPSSLLIDELPPLNLRMIVCICKRELSEMKQNQHDFERILLSQARDVGPVGPRFALILELHDVFCKQAGDNFKPMWAKQWSRLLRSCLVRIDVVDPEAMRMKRMTAHQDLKSDFASCKRIALMSVMERVIFRDKMKNEGVNLAQKY